MRKSALFAAITLSAALAVVGCNSSKKKPKIGQVVAPRYTAQPLRKVPPWLKNSIYEQIQVVNTGPDVVSGYGLVVNLEGTGDTTAPIAVKEYVKKTMQKRGFGNRTIPGYENLDPTRVLADPRVAIVRVDALIPPGAKKGDRIDVQVSTIPENNTSSLASGQLYLTDVSPNGGNIQNPTIVEKNADAQGPLFVNPAYAVHPDLNDPEQKRSLRKAVVLGGGIVAKERPLGLLNLSAERRMARMIEDRIDLAFQDQDIAAAQDEGRVLLRVPNKYRGDWQHFIGVVEHTFFAYNDQFAVKKAQEIVAEMHKPDAPLGNMSFALEALGPVALPIYTPLMSDPNPEIAFAATRAAAFAGDVSAPGVLAEMAMATGNPYRVDAVATLAAMPASPAINQTLRTLLGSDESLVRIAAFRALTANGDTGSMLVKQVPSSEYLEPQFRLQVAQSNATPIIYATRSGVPTIAIIGDAAQLKLPTFHSALDDKLTISSSDNVVTITQRAYEAGKLPITVRVRPNLEYVIAALGGENVPGQPGLKLNYNQVVGILMDLTSQNKVQAAYTKSSVAFVLQDSATDPNINSAPVIPAERQQRPISQAQPEARPAQASR